MTLPPSDLSLEEEEKRFYAALGKAITQWQHVEEGVAVIFCEIVGPVFPDINWVANAAFHTVLNFESKLGMTDSAIQMRYFDWSKAHPGEPCLPLIEWTPLHNRTQRRARRRNELAHFAPALDEKRRPGFRFFLMPNTVDARAWMRHGGRPPERNTNVITAMGNAFEKAGDDLKDFFQRHLIPDKPKLPSASA